MTNRIVSTVGLAFRKKKGSKKKKGSEGQGEGVEEKKKRRGQNLWRRSRRGQIFG